MSSAATLPLLLPARPTKTTNYPSWKYQRYHEALQPPVIDDQGIHDLEFAVQHQLLDGKVLKKTPPRRRWTMREGWAVGRWSVQTPEFRHLELALTTVDYPLRLV
jgi:hypothetical protein